MPAIIKLKKRDSIKREIASGFLMLCPYKANSHHGQKLNQIMPQRRLGRGENNAEVPFGIISILEFARQILMFATGKLLINLSIYSTLICDSTQSNFSPDSFFIPYVGKGTRC
jgi:hypothetical protein